VRPSHQAPTPLAAPYLSVQSLPLVGKRIVDAADAWAKARALKPGNDLETSGSNRGKTDVAVERLRPG